MPFGIFGGRFDVHEFIFGFILGLLFYVLLRRTKPALKTILEWLRDRGRAIIESFTSSSEEPYYQDLKFQLDCNHLANPLFPFSQIIIPPRILLPSPPTDPVQAEESEDLYYTILPALPDWNVLESLYQSPSIPITHLLDSGENILITGELGSGKTSALIFLAFTCMTRIAQNPKAKNKFPVFLHAANLDLSRKATKDPLDVIVKTVQRTSSIGLTGFLARYLRLHLQNNPGLILLDGIDELTEDEIPPVRHWISQLRSKYPQHQIIAAGAPRGYGSILKTGLFPVPIAPWNNYDLEAYLDKWASNWQTHVVRSSRQVGEIDPILLNSWMKVARVGYTPLEVTVKVWSYYIGDTQGKSLENSLQAYVKRILSPNEQHAAQAIALTWIRSRNSSFPTSSMDKRLPLQDLINANILIRQSDEQLRFTNPSIGSFLAAGGILIARKLSINPEDLWEPSRATLRYYAALGDIASLVSRTLQSADDQLASSLLTCASWLPKSKQDSPWRNQVLAAMAKVIQDDLHPYGLRLRILQALVASNEQPAKALFKRMLASGSSDSRVLAILGMGGIRNTECIQDLRALIESDKNDTVRFAACIALAAIGNTQSLEILGHYLINGDDASQLLSSQALASHPGEGVPMLKEALGMDSVRIRRAAVFGLGRVQSDEVIRILEKIRLEDNETIVQNAAAEMLDSRLSPPNKLSLPANEPSSLPWLLTYAAKNGLGVMPGKGALEMLRRVIVSGSQREKIAAFEAIGLYHANDLTLEVSQALKDNDSAIRHAAYESLWHLKAPKSVNQPTKEPTPA